MMTFEDYWMNLKAKAFFKDPYHPNFPTKWIAEAAWKAAQEAERARLREYFEGELQYYGGFRTPAIPIPVILGMLKRAQEAP